MSTRSNIGYVDDETGEIRAVYCQFDGYPGGVLKGAIEYIESTSPESFVKEIERGVRESGFRSFNSGGGTSYYDYRKDLSAGDEWLTTERNQLYNDYAYIFSKQTGELKEAYEYGELVLISYIMKGILKVH